MGVAVILGVGRTIIRFRRFRRLFADDICLFMAMAALIGGTSITYTQTSFLFTTLNVQNGIETAPIDFIESLGSNEGKIAAALILLWLSIFGVKFSFCFLFRSLIRRVNSLNIWWWCVIAFLVPAAGLCSFSIFISCPAFGANVLSMLPCNSPKYQHTLTVSNCRMRHTFSFTETKCFDNIWWGLRYRN